MLYNTKARVVLAPRQPRSTNLHNVMTLLNRRLSLSYQQFDEDESVIMMMMTKTKKLKVSVGNLHNVMRHVCEFKSEDTALIADKWTALCVTFIF